jgi:hypothetical protein
LEQLADGGLTGSWAATRWHYRRIGQPEREVDVVAGLGGSVTLSLSDGTYVLTSEMAGRGRASAAGTVAVDGERLVFRPHGAGSEQVVGFRLSGQTLALSAADSAWAFERDEEPAEFVAVLVRL